MGIGLLFAGLATLCGVAVNRALGAHWSLAPFSGLALLAVLGAWCAALGLPAVTGTLIVVAIAGVGLAISVRSASKLRAQNQRRPHAYPSPPPSPRNGERVPPFSLSPLGERPRAARVRGTRQRPARLFHHAVSKLQHAGKSTDRVTVGVLGAAVLLPWLLLGAALAAVEAPVSTHDGAFHVEVIDSLRRGVPVQGWYPMGFHASVAAVLRLVPWLDTARGTVEATQALTILAPLGVFALGLSLGLGARLASLGALIVSLTYIYPYDNQMWAGWPLATGLLLLMGLWSVALRWIAEPRAGLAVLAGLLAGAILLAHGTEVYSAVLGLSVIAAMRWRRIQFQSLVRHLPLALLIATVCALPYLSTLLGWAIGGGASAAGASSLDEVSSPGQESASGGNWLEFVLAMTGAASLIDLPLRALLLFVGVRQRRLRTAVAGWLVFGALLFAASFLDIAPVRQVYVLTFPWLVHHRPPQLVVLFTSLLVGGGLFVVVSWFWSQRSRLSARPAAWRRVALVSGAFMLFFAEGSAVSIFKTLQQIISDQNVYLVDDRAAMSWLRVHAASDEVVINDAAADAGIWAPYKAGLGVLLPRSAPGALQEERGPILRNVLWPEAEGAVAEASCSLRADYVFAGSRTVGGDATVWANRHVLEQSVALHEVFVSGEAAIFRVETPCHAMVADAPSTR